MHCVVLIILFVWVIKFAFTVIAFVRIHCFFMRKLNKNTALLQKTIKTNWNFALSIRNFTLRLA